MKALIEFKWSQEVEVDDASPKSRREAIEKAIAITANEFKGENIVDILRSMSPDFLTEIRFK